MKNEKNWIELLLSIVILIMMSVIVYLSLIVDDKNMEIERLQRRVWEYQQKYSLPKPNKADDYNFMRKNIEEIKDHR